MPVQGSGVPVAEFVREVRERLKRPGGPFIDAADAAGFYRRKARMFAVLAEASGATELGVRAARAAAAARAQAERYARESAGRRAGTAVTEGAVAGGRHVGA